MNNDFSSLERLMELGLSMAVAQQMMQTMNRTLSTMQAPAGGLASVPAASSTYYAVVDGSQAGPFTSSEMETLVKNGRLNDATLVWKAGMPGWKYAREVAEINKLFLLYPAEK